jgi:ribosome recycling factor
MVDVQTYYKTAQDKMESAILYLDDVLARIRAGKANVRILDGIKVDYYGTPSPLANVATIATPDARTISIQPWEKKMISSIEKAIMASDVGITPENNGEIIRLTIPVLTEERRKTLVKQTKSEGEEAKVRIRNIRREIIEGLKKEVKNGLSEDLEKDAEAEVQKIHDKYIKKVDELLVAKEKEIMTV